MYFEKSSLGFIMIGIPIWLIDSWAWLLNDIPIGPLNLVGIGLIFIGATGLCWQLRRSSSGLLFLGSLLWLMGNFAAWQGNNEVLLGVSRFGEMLFFLSLMVVGMSLTKKSLKRGWIFLFVMTLASITARVGTALFGNDPFETMPIVLGTVMTVYVVFLFLLLHATREEMSS